MERERERERYMDRSIERVHTDISSEQKEREREGIKSDK